MVDCGPPDQEQTLGGTNLTVDCTTLNCSFEFRCDGGKEPLPLGVSTTITCMADGKWNYSSIYCEGSIEYMCNILSQVQYRLRSVNALLYMLNRYCHM